MQIHGRAKRGPAGRLALTKAMMDGHLPLLRWTRTKRASRTHAHARSPARAGALSRVLFHRPICGPTLGGRARFEPRERPLDSGDNEGKCRA